MTPMDAVLSSQVGHAEAPRPQARRRGRTALGVAAAVVALGAAFWFTPWSEPIRNLMTTAAEPPPKPAPIDGDRAYKYLNQICAIGPRKAGSAANKAQRDLVAAHFQKHGAAVREQPFRARDPKSRKPVDMANLIGSWFPERAERVLLAVHYDTRPFPDRDPDFANRDKPFIGANDGASGVALLMEIAHHLSDSTTPWGVDLVLLDGEELVYEGADDIKKYFLGSRAFGKAYEADRKSGKLKDKYVAGIVLDMVGDRDLAIDREVNSQRLARKLNDEIWAVAAQIKEPAFRDQIGPEVRDDHLSLNDAGIPTIDLIDFEYPHWHTSQDLPENCSGESLKAVGRVVTAWLNQPKAKPKRR